MRTYHNISLVNNLFTLYHQLPDGRNQAVLFLPSSWESTTSASRCTVSYKTGKITKKSDPVYVTEATVEEMNSQMYRIGAKNNVNSLFSANEDPIAKDGLTDMLVGWAKNANANLLRVFYGGDFKTYNTLLCLVEAAKQVQEKEFLLITGKPQHLLTLQIQYPNLPENLHFYAWKANYINLNLSSFPKVEYSYDKEVAIPALDFWPTSEKKDVTFLLTDDCRKALDTKKPWWIDICADVLPLLTKQEDSDTLLT